MRKRLGGKQGVLWAGLALAGTFVSAAEIRAQDYPARTIKMVVPYPAGGITDVLPRVMSEWLTRKWGQAIVAAGGKVDTFELPRMGIKGNTHMMMMDRNSDQVAGVVRDWLAAQKLVP